ncbi:unnamed protein product [Linum tenue]|uniref:Uncharacterized protein n=1 Tax=Linum tenue TaxID=586396 RepID=A0AAV0L787_9ROSI|nr:unnamed protein product [Linum tenue]CAI0428893.1 unnamed protein product [Linum tenue]
MITSRMLLSTHQSPHTHLPVALSAPLSPSAAPPLSHQLADTHHWPPPPPLPWDFSFWISSSLAFIFSS